MVQKSVPRGRPRGFDPDQVLADVRDTFWRFGFAGTSMDQLAASTGLHKPGLYGAFGDKKALYLKALEHYLEGVRHEFGAALSEPKLADSLRLMIDTAIATFTRDDGAGCFMLTTAVPEAGDDSEINSTVRAAMDSLDRALTRRFQKAIEVGELPPEADVATLTMIVVANHYEISARARAGYPIEALQALRDRTLALVARLGTPA